MKNVFLTNSNSTPMIKTSNYSVQSISNNTIKKKYSNYKNDNYNFYNNNNKSINELNESREKNKNIEFYPYPLALNSFGNLRNNILFRIQHPEKPIDKKNIINFKSNPKLKKYSSSINIKKKYSINNNNNDIDYSLLSNIKKNDKNNNNNKYFYIINNYFNNDLSSTEIEKKINELEENPYSMKSQKFMKEIKLKEIQQRGFFNNKLKLAKIKRIALNNFSMFNEENFDNINNNNNNNLTNNFNDSIYKSNNNNNFNQNIPKLKDYMKFKYKLLKEKEKSKIENKIYNNFNDFDEFNEFNSEIKNILPLINMKKDNFKFKLFKGKNGKEKDLSLPTKIKIKMTPEYIRDLNILNKINKFKEKDFVDELKIKFLNNDSSNTNFDEEENNNIIINNN